MKFRVSLPQSAPIVIDLPQLQSDTTATLDDLVNSLLMHDSIPTSLKQCAISLKVGFPPTKVDLLKNGSSTLKDLKIANGEKIIIEEDTGSSGKIVKGTNVGPYVPPSTNVGYFVRRKQPSDNSCLFHSLSYVLNGKNNGKVKELREICAHYVAENPKVYTTEFLGMRNIEYANWILHEDTWGGAIEISILSAYYKVRIIAFDTTTCREDVYGSDHDEYTAMALIIYTGDHYDALCLNPNGEEGSPDKDIVLFNVKDVNILGKARAYVQEEHKKFLSRRK
ncbi:hypothetical protein FDP41_003951 [Naegleria fowleri]|uniref:Ubiquitin thioesterase OTU n=1 Tax=Naegleria fowleri TaxID=5763 RepID=A0A6A5BTL6_NAEFO|nr:uncharacterized protein FDP41_003951 [Naegleria fowleri]KAF0977298.1 hypothetical protein FDP41_003951 [Naegleria fowleri]